jgi:hypothetical protein
MANGNRPIREFTAGSVRASIWYDEVTRGADKFFPVFNVKVERRYRDAAGNWQSASSFRRRDLADLELVVFKCREYVSLNEREPGAR